MQWIQIKNQDYIRAYRNSVTGLGVVASRGIDSDSFIQETLQEKLQAGS